MELGGLVAGFFDEFAGRAEVRGFARAEPPTLAIGQARTLDGAGAAFEEFTLERDPEVADEDYGLAPGGFQDGDDDDRAGVADVFPLERVAAGALDREEFEVELLTAVN
jgi:hypothetical protein